MKTQVRKISHKGQSSIVEWEDGSGFLHRSVFPSSEIVEENNNFFVEDVEDGYPDGTDWESLIHTQIGPKGIADLLRRNGIWTLEDYAMNSAVVTSVFNQACTANLQHFKEAVLRYGKGE